MADETDLYRYFDDEGRLLYVGISFSAFARAVQHKRESVWFPKATFMTVEQYSSRKAACKAEEKAIKSEHPMFNITFSVKNTPKATRLQKSIKNPQDAVKRQALEKRAARLRREISELEKIIPVLEVKKKELEQIVCEKKNKNSELKNIVSRQDKLTAMIFDNLAQARVASLHCKWQAEEKKKSRKGFFQSVMSLLPISTGNEAAI